MKNSHLFTFIILFLGIIYFAFQQNSKKKEAELETDKAKIAASNLSNQNKNLQTEKQNLQARINNLPPHLR